MFALKLAIRAFERLYFRTMTELT